MQSRESEKLNYETTPLLHIQEILGVTTNENFFQTLFVYENYPAEKISEAISLVKDVIGNEAPNYPLSIVGMSQEILSISFTYDDYYYNEEIIVTLMEQFKRLTLQLIATPEVTIKEVSLISAQEKQQLLAWSTWSSTEGHSAAPVLPVGRDTLVLDLFEEQVANHPHHIAVMFNESTQVSERLTYKELNDKANQGAHYLVEQGVTPDTLVGLCVERSLEMIVGIWGILKAGGAYVPIDPDYPESHIEHILEDSDIDIMLTSSELLSELPFDELQILPLDDEMWEGFLGSYSLENVERQTHGVSLNNLAYVIYTSGSTGLPKGVVVEHHSLVQSTLSRFEVYEESPSSFALFSSFAFDSSVAGIFWTLVSGGKLCIVDIKQGVDLRAFQTLMLEGESLFNAPECVSGHAIFRYSAELIT